MRRHREAWHSEAALLACHNSACHIIPRDTRRNPLALAHMRLKHETKRLIRKLLSRAAGEDLGYFALVT